MKNTRLRSLLNLSLIVVSIVFIFHLTTAVAQDQNKFDSSDSLSVSEPPIRLTMLPDQEVVKVGEKVAIQVLVESSSIKAAKATISFPTTNFELQGSSSQTFDLPMASPLVFTLVSRRPGKCNMLMHVSGVNLKTNKQISVSQKLLGLEVKVASFWWQGLSSSTLSGVFLGALLTVLTTFFNDYRQRRKEEAQRRHWLIKILPTQLEADRLAILAERETMTELWMSKLLTEGYYTDLWRVAEQKQLSSNPASLLLKLGFDVRNYEKDRVDKRVASTQREALDGKLIEVIEILREI
jgi:hypothetical protein